MTIQIRSIRSDEFVAYSQAISAAFSFEQSAEELAVDGTIAEHDREFAAFDGDEIVGGATAVTFRMTVPGGGRVACGGVPRVGVKPTHRRRGINTALMRAQLDDMHARGEPLSALHASEAGIYSSFGFGQASFLGELEVETARTAFARHHRPTGRVRLVPRDEALGLMRPVYDAVVASRPGMIVLNDAWFAWRFGQTASERSDHALFFAIHETRGAPDAYAVYYVKSDWPQDIPRSELMLREIMATSPDAYADMWRFVFDIDLIHVLRTAHLAADEPLLWLVREPRRLHFMLSDGVWIRLVDVPAALAARAFAGDGRVVFEVTDEFCPWNEGRYALEVAEGEVACARTDDSPDIACRVNELASTYLGGASFAALARAGLIDERTQGGIDRADALFRCDPAPWCSLPF